MDWMQGFKLSAKAAQPRQRDAEGAMRGGGARGQKGPEGCRGCPGYAGPLGVASSGGGWALAAC